MADVEIQVKDAFFAHRLNPKPYSTALHSMNQHLSLQRSQIRSATHQSKNHFLKNQSLSDCPQIFGVITTTNSCPSNNFPQGHAFRIRSHWWPFDLTSFARLTTGLDDQRKVGDPSEPSARNCTGVCFHAGIVICYGDLASLPEPRGLLWIRHGFPLHYGVRHFATVVFNKTQLGTGYRIIWSWSWIRSFYTRLHCLRAHCKNPRFSAPQLLEQEYLHPPFLVARFLSGMYLPMRILLNHFSVPNLSLGSSIES